MSDDGSEKCQRCGSVGQDRRTLWMSCFYDMMELGIPFVQKILLDGKVEDLEKADPPVTIPLPGREGEEPGTLCLQAGTVRSKGVLTLRQLYTLRVCKRCRGEWMAAIKEWFIATPQDFDHDADERPPYEGPGTGIFVRDHGAVREITQQEWNERAAKKGEGR